MKIHIVVVAHAKRRDDAEKLAKTVAADHIVWDHGNVGVTGNHRAAWSWHASHPADWSVTIEDDAVPCPQFRRQLSKALAVSPAHVVSLYMGRLHPSAWQEVFEGAVERADEAEASFIVGRHVLHAVGLAANHGGVAMMNTALQVFGIYAPDAAIGEWTRRNAIDVAYTHPSLVDHADGVSLVTPTDGALREKGRVAWRHGGRKNWDETSVAMIVPGGGPK